MDNYQSASDKLGKRESRKLQNNTYLQRRDADTIAVRYHDTDVVTFHADGRIVLATGGWKTSTTKERLNNWSPICLYSDRGVWYFTVRANTPHYRIKVKRANGRYAVLPQVYLERDWKLTEQVGEREGGHARMFRDESEVYAFADGLTLVPGSDLQYKVMGEASNPKAILKLRAQVNRFASGFVQALQARRIPEPSDGDCFYCRLREVGSGKPLGEVSKDGDHIRSHIREKYYVPSLLRNALDWSSSQAMKSLAWSHLEGNNPAEGWPASDRLWADLKKTLARYCLLQLGEAA